MSKESTIKQYFASDAALPGTAEPQQLASIDSRGVLERLPKWLIVLPQLVYWLILSLRYRSLTLPSLANPKITSGGLLGEGKIEYFHGMGALALAATAANGSFVVEALSAADAAAACMQRANIAFPIIAKPDIGWCGFGVRRIDTAQALAEYLDAYPVGERVVLQAYVPDAGEAGLFYVRLPGEKHGRLLGLALRFFPQVTGDGRSTVAELIALEPRLCRLGADGLHRIEVDLLQIPEAGEQVRLATIGSTRIGGLYRDGGALITSALSGVIDAIARDMPEFYFGRFDVRYSNAEALMRGEGFKIIEVNGAGSEAIEAWDPDISARAAFKKIFVKQRLLFEVAAANRQRGYKTMSLWHLAALHLRQQKLIRQYPLSN